MTFSFSMFSQNKIVHISVACLVYVNMVLVKSESLNLYGSIKIYASILKFIHVAIILLAFRFGNDHHAHSKDEEEKNILLSDGDSDDLPSEGEIEEELENENEELSAGRGRENVSVQI